MENTSDMSPLLAVQDRVKTKLNLFVDLSILVEDGQLTAADYAQLSPGEIKATVDAETQCFAQVQIAVEEMIDWLERLRVRRGEVRRKIEQQLRKEKE